MNTELINSMPIIAILTPLTLAFILGLFKEKYMLLKRSLAVVATVVSFFAVLLLIKPILVDGQIITLWMGNWAPINGVAFGIGLEIDALSLFLALIITVASLLSVIYSLKYMSKDNGLEKYYVLFLLLTASMLGFVFTGDLFNMYVMLEIMTFSAIALTAFRNYKDKSVEAAFKYIVTGSLGSSLILLGTALLYMQTRTLNIAEITAVIRSNGEFTPVMILAFTTIIVGYAVKAFMVPCHTWPTDAHMAAPSSISMILSGVMSKTGVYGIIRLVFILFGLSNNKYVGFLILIWGIITMVIGVSMALLQHDFKRLLAFHSVSQIGYIITALGIAILETGSIRVLAMTGSLYHMINHALFKGLLFLTAGAVLYVTGTTDLESLSGLGKKMPFTMAMFLVGAAAISGIPPFNGFVSKWIIYESGFSSSYGLVSVIAVIVSALTLASFIKVGHSAFFGPLRKAHSKILRVPTSMKIPMVILALGTIIFGVFPNLIISKLLLPVVKSIMNVGIYVSTALGDKYNNLFFVEDLKEINYEAFGIYEPTNFLMLFIILFAAISIAIIFKGEGTGEEIKEGDGTVYDAILHRQYEDKIKFNNNKSRAKYAEGAKYDVFVGGEEGDDVKVSPNDLFWAMKYQFRGYFKVIQDGHSGNVNDYSLWIIATLAIVTIFTFICL